MTYRVARSLNSMVNTNDRVLNTRGRQEVFTRTRITRTLVLDCSRLPRQDLDTALILALSCNIFINIRKLVYDYVDYRYHNDYLAYLSVNPITNCPRLEYISAARHILDSRFERRHNFRLYFDICLRFSSNITDLYLPCFNLLELDPVAFVFLLHNFSSLKNRLLGHETRIVGDFALNVIAFFFIHKHYRNMEPFRFEAQHSFPITDDEELPTTISTITNNNIMQTINTRDQNNQQSSRLKYLDLHLNSLQSSYTTLICNNYFPIDGHQLRSFILTLRAQTIQRFFLRNNIDTLLLFANSLATCPIVEISATGRGGWNTLARQRNTLVEVQIAYNNCRRF